MRALADPYPDALARIINARIEGDQATALAEMNQIRFLPPERKAERWPAMSVIAGVYARDRYQCRYCGERVILTAVMRLVSRLYPDLFPYHPNWKADSTHPAPSSPDPQPLIMYTPLRTEGIRSTRPIW
jgi:hypothetical protein